MASQGSINVDQAHRGYAVSADAAGQTAWSNPFYMRYAPDEDGNFAGQGGYGYVSIEKFIDAAAAVNAAATDADKEQVLAALDTKGGAALPTLANTLVTTAILEAGRRSLDGDGRAVRIATVDGEWTLD
jgi:D-galacturonate reductase